MPKQKMKLETSTGEKELELSWGFAFRNFKILIDGEVLADQLNTKQLKEGWENIVDGAILKIQMKQNFLTPEIQTLYDDRPVVGSASDPNIRIKNAFGVVIFLIALNLGIGSFAFFGNNEMLLSMGYGVYNLSIGALYTLLFVLGKKFSPLVALSIILLIFFGDAGMAIKQQIDLNLNVGGGWVIVRLIIITGLSLGIKGAWELKKST